MKREETHKNKTDFQNTANRSKWAEESQRKGKEKYRNVFKNIEEGYFEVDLAGNFTFFNDNVCRILGYPREELMSMNNRQYTDKEEFKKIFQAFNKVYKTGEPNRELVHQITRKDGIKRYIEGFIYLQKDSSGKPRGFGGIGRDITEHKQAERILRANEERLRGITQNLPGIIFQFYAKDSGEYGLSYISEPLAEFSEIVEYVDTANLDALFPLFLSRIHEEDRDKFLTSIKAAVETETSWNFEGRITIQAGKIIWIHGLSTPTRHEDQLVFDGILLNITDRKQTEELLKESEVQYRLLADHMKDQIWVTDLNLKFTYISPSLEKSVGYTLKELKQLPLDKLFTATSLQTVMDVHSTEVSKAIIKPPTPCFKRLVELECRCKDGRLLWVECMFSFIQDEDGKPLSILGEGRNITERKLAEEKLQQTLESFRNAIGTTIRVLVSAIESKDPYTAGHQKRVADLARTIAVEMGLPHDIIEGIRMAGIIHDIGKLSIPSEILSKPTTLKDIEFSLLKEHSQSGYEMLKDVESPWPLAQIVYQHHERMNGSGYPRNLKGDEIIIEARIMAVADVVEAMASHRPYRPALGIDIALEEIEKNKGILYDDAVTDACLKLFREKGYKLT